MNNTHGVREREKAGGGARRVNNESGAGGKGVIVSGYNTHLERFLALHVGLDEHG